MITIYQIYYEGNQLEILEKDGIFKPFFNKKCTVFFENWVIKTLLEQNKHKYCDYFGVFSPKFKLKCPNFTLENLKKAENLHPDVILLKNEGPHDPITLADRYHPNFSKQFKNILQHLGFNWSPEVYNNVVNSNHFIAKSSIYEEYFNQLLLPAIKLMYSMPELTTDSKYIKKLPQNLRLQWGFNFYPMHTFLCERMFSYFIHKNNLKTIYA